MIKWFQCLELGILFIFVEGRRFEYGARPAPLFRQFDISFRLLFLRKSLFGKFAIFISIFKFNMLCSICNTDLFVL